jgi:DNA-binding SARP family transcriptional activator/tetratricopeptide (TPR) repeat protein
MVALSLPRCAGSWASPHEGCAYAAAVGVAVDVLGPLRVRVGDEERVVAGRRERLLLALLATSPGRHVADARLVDELWGDEPPASAASALQVAVSRVRRVLGAEGEVRRDPAGYTLVGAEVDAVAVTQAAQAVTAADPETVLAATGEALARWRGSPYAGLEEAPTLAAEAARLGDVELALVEARAQALLDLGRPEESTALLAAEAPAHPFRERLWSLLALAQYRCDRQADALETLRTLRTALVDELGVDPSATVRRLEERMLAQDPELSATLTARSPSREQVGADATRGRLSGVVGRAAALATIHDSIGDLVDGGRGGMLLISGEAGIGKSMLATELAHQARERGARVLVGRCHEADLAPPYWPWLPIVRELAAHAHDVEPEVARLLESRVTDDPESGDAGAAAATTMRTFAAVTRLLDAQPVPVVVLLEDLHWADQTSLRLLVYAAEELRGCPVLLVATVRTVDQRQHPHLVQALAGLSRLGARRVPVPALDEQAVSALVVDVVPEADAELVEVLTRRSDGNPFFVLELARLIVATGDPTAAAAARLDVPDGIADVLRLRLLQLSQATQETLAVASVSGRTFDPAVLAAALGREPYADLDEAIAAGLVEEPEPRRLRFVHALTRETLYRDLPTWRRAEWHAAVGKVLAGKLARDPELVEEVAHHHAVAAAYLPELAEDALAYGERAAVAAERRGAYDEAAALWSRALDTERLVPDPDRDRRHRLLLATATARQRVGDMHGMLRVLDEAIKAAQSVGDYQRMAEAASALRSSGVWHWRETGEHDLAMVATIQECLEHVDELALRARLLANLGLEQYMAHDFPAAHESGLRAIELARASGDRAVLRDCLVSREVALFTPGGAAEHEVWARESLTVVGDDPEYVIPARFHLATALHSQGRGDEADEAIAPAYALAAQLRYTGSDVPLGWLRWLRAVETGSPAADAIGREALARHRRTTVVGLAELSALHTIVTAGVGAPVPADVVADAQGHPFRPFRAVVAHAVALAGDPTGAVRLLGDDLVLGGDYAALLAGCLTVEVLRLAGDERLRQAVDQIRPFTHEVATYGSVQSFGSAALFAGSGLVALGDVEDGRALLEQAVAVNAALRSVRWSPEARERLAALG